MPPTTVPATISASVPLTLGLQLGGSTISFGAIVPGVAQVYQASVPATVTSTAGNATLSAVDADGDDGRLGSGAFKLASPLRVRATNGANPNTAFAPLTATPMTLLTYDTWISNDAVTLTVQQPIGALEPLAAGTYAKVIRLTLASTSP
jgi:hypothetical protein